MVIAGVKQWELARELGVVESVISRKLRDELPTEEQEKLVKVIEGMKVRNK